MKKPPITRGPGMSMSDYKGAVGSMFGSFTSGIGAVRRRTNRGKDLLLQEGDVVPVRVTRSVDLTKMSPPTQPAAPLANPYSNSGAPGGNVTGTAYGAGIAPGSAPMTNPMSSPMTNPMSAPLGYQPMQQPGQSAISGDAPLLPKELPDPF